LTNSPAEIDESSKISSENQGTDFHGVSRTHSSESSPGDGTEESTDKQSLDVWSEECDEDESSHHDETDKHDNSMSILVSEVSITKSADDVTHSLDVLKSCLPWSG